MSRPANDRRSSSRLEQMVRRRRPGAVRALRDREGLIEDGSGRRQRVDQGGEQVALEIARHHDDVEGGRAAAGQLTRSGAPRVDAQAVRRQRAHRAARIASKFTSTPKVRIPHPAIGVGCERPLPIAASSARPPRRSAASRRSHSTTNGEGDIIGRDFGSSAAHRGDSRSRRSRGHHVVGLRGTDICAMFHSASSRRWSTLLAHSMMMFYLIGKGKAVKDAMAEHSVDGRLLPPDRRRAQAGVLDRHAGDGRDDGRRDPGRQRRHRRAAADRPRDDRLRRRSPATSPPPKIEIDALRVQPRIVDEVEPPARRRDHAAVRRRARRTSQGTIAGSRPLRIAAAHGRCRRAASRSSDLDQPAAEVFVNLVTGAVAARRGRIVAVRPADGARSPTAPTGSPSSIGSASSATRAVLLDRADRRCRTSRCRSRSTIEPPPDDVRGRAPRELAPEAGLPRAAWPAPVGELDAAAQMRCGLARALALDPAVLLLEHVSAGASTADRRAGAGPGSAASSATEPRRGGRDGVDEPFARAGRARACSRWDPATGRPARTARMVRRSTRLEYWQGREGDRHDTDEALGCWLAARHARGRVWASCAGAAKKAAAKKAARVLHRAEEQRHGDEPGAHEVRVRGHRDRRGSARRRHDHASGQGALPRRYRSRTACRRARTS